ncbi:EAL domain-containing protein [Endozoicomonas arenosclerae]|uniref:EAL domain-containing protein n=1 Tax=Endozoicomonas arenosclerae TaxID=1633495 RepID=UPI0015611D14|nr:EAL domain-containing protein [Endozoicomonas arenosclerae]
MNNNKQPVRLLTLETSRNEAERWVKLFRNAGLPARVQQIDTLDDLDEALTTGLWDLLLTVEETSMLNAEQVLSSVQRLKLDIPVIVSVQEDKPDIIKHWLDKGAGDAILHSHEEHMLHAILREKSSQESRQQLQKLHKELSDLEQRCQLLMDNASQAIAYVHEGMHIDTNPSYIELFGYEDPDDLAGMPLIDMISSQDQPLFKNLIKHFKPGDEQPAVECQLMNAEGQAFPATVLLSDAVFDDEQCIQVIVKGSAPANASSTVIQQEEDSILIPRKHFVSLLDTEQEPETLAYLRLDNYDSIRENIGIEGSIAAQETMNRILFEQLPNSTATHYADEVYLINVHERDIAALEPLRDTLEKELINAGQQTLYTTASVGLAEKGQEGDGKSLLERAHFACQLATDDGGNKLEFFSQSAIDNQKASNGDTVAMIRQALENDSFRLLFQPVISVTGEGQGYYEVLLRLLDQKGKEVPAGEFITAAEDSDLMPFIDRWVIRQSVKLLSRKLRNGDDTRMMIHISQASLDDEEFAERLARLLEAADVPGHMIILQMTERLVHQHLNQVKTFAERLKPVGCKFAMTQFSGESRSMKIMEHLDLMFVKLDYLFTEKLERNDDSQLKKATNNLKALNKVIIMPRVENAQTLTSIWQLGVDYVQGHYLQPPLESMTYDFSS